MPYVAILLLIFCLAIGFMHKDITKMLLAVTWVAMALSAAGATLWSLGRLLFA